MSNSVAIGIVVGLIIVYLGIFGFAIAEYVLSSLGRYKLAKGRQISDPWMAWIPVVNDFLLGRITEQVDENRGINRKWSKVMLALALANVVGLVLFFAVYFGMFIVMIIQTGSMSGELTSAEIAGPILGMFIAVFVVAFIMAFASVAYTACTYVCIYKVFESAVPDRSLKYFLLSMLVPLAHGICLLKSAKLDVMKPMPEEKVIVDQLEDVEEPESWEN